MTWIKWKWMKKCSHFIQVTISLIIYSYLSFGDIWALQFGRTCVTHKNPVYDFAHHKSPITQWLERSNQYSGRSWVRLPLGNSEKSFSEYLTWDHFYTHFLFIQVTISLLIYSHLSFGHIWALQPGRTCVAHKNPVYDFAHHESPIAQWLECSNRYSGRSWVRLPLGNSEKSFSEYLTWDHFYTHYQKIAVKCCCITVQGGQWYKLKFTWHDKGTLLLELFLDGMSDCSNYNLLWNDKFLNMFDC